MLFALVAMLVLFAVGLWRGELLWLHIFYAVLVALLGFDAFVFFGWHQAGYTAVIGAIDIVLILMIFKGDISIR